MGLTITGFVKDFRPLMEVEIARVGGEQVEAVIALIDTGATDCVVRPALIERLGIPVTETVHSHNIGSRGMKSVCRIDLRFWHRGIDRWWLGQNARAIVDEFDPCAEIIIGMNVLRAVTLTFRDGVPEIETP
jgi:predicted aspartyl protease